MQAPWRVNSGCESRARLFTGRHYELPNSTICCTCPFYCEDKSSSGRGEWIVDIHMREFDGTTFGMSVEASSPAFKRMKRNVFTGEIVRCRGLFKQTVRCVRAADVAAVMGEAGWLVSEGRYMETIRWGNDETEYHITYEEGSEK